MRGGEGVDGSCMPLRTRPAPVSLAFLSDHFIVHWDWLFLSPLFISIHGFSLLCLYIPQRFTHLSDIEVGLDGVKDGEVKTDSGHCSNDGRGNASPKTAHSLLTDDFRHDASDGHAPSNA